MPAYKVLVEIDGRNVESIVKAGILASVEIGTQSDKTEIPSYKVVIVASANGENPTAWVQLSRYESNSFTITHEGWIKKNSGSIPHIRTGSSISASVSEEKSLPENIVEAHAKLQVGMMSCCTSSGNGGCYVRCCNSCCSDPARCPGASCCG